MKKLNIALACILALVLATPLLFEAAAYAQAMTQPVVQVSNNGKIITPIVQRATGAAAVATTVAPSTSTVGAYELIGYKVHLSAAGGAGNLTATVDDASGAAYDVVLVTQDMTSTVNLVQMFDPPIPMDSGDEIDFAWANGSTRTYGLEIYYQRLP